MKAVALLLLIAVSAQAQSMAEIARRERARQSNAKPTRIITSHGTFKPEESKPGDAAAASKGAAAPPAAAQQPAVVAPDPVQVWNKQIEELRLKIRALQDQEMALVLQQNQATNQVFAPITDPASQQKAQVQLGDVQKQLAAVRKDLDDSKKLLDSLQLQGPPKK